MRGFRGPKWTSGPFSNPGISDDVRIWPTGSGSKRHRPTIQGPFNTHKHIHPYEKNNERNGTHGCIQIWAKIRNSLFRPYLYTTVYVLKKKHKVTTENLTKRGPKWKRPTVVYKYGRFTDVYKYEKGPRFRGLLTYITTYILTKKIANEMVRTDVYKYEPK